MATGRASRLEQRLRGAGRVNVGSDGFDLNIDGIEQPFAPASSSSPAAGQRPSLGAAPPRSSPQTALGPPPEEPQPQQPSSPPPLNRLLISSPPRASNNPPFHEEITESPVHAPGSGHRRRVPAHEASSALDRTNGVTRSGFQPINQPVLTKTPRPAQVSPPAEPRQAPIDDDDDDDDDNSPVPPQRAPRPSATELSTAARPAAPHSTDEDRAEEISDREAALRIGQKRPRASLEPSPELGSDDTEADPVREQPASKRARPPPPPPPQPPARREPALQRQPKKRNAAEGHVRNTTAAADNQNNKRSDGPNKRRGRQRKETAKRNTNHRQGSADDTIIEVTVQRFVNGDDGGSDEGAQSEIPFANRSGETVVDVFAQVCEEVIATTLGKYQFLLENTPDEAKKKDCRIKMRAIESFREEVSAQLLQHSIYLNHWYSLRKRIRHVQKKKLRLRQEILRLKAEKEQVALRMDSVRARSEKDATESKQRIDASALMHEIDLAVERGRDENELSSRAQREADLGNLELLISQVADQASSKGPNGGLLHQIQEFNAFLERAAKALER